MLSADQPLQVVNLCLLPGDRGSLLGELRFLPLRDGLLLLDEDALRFDLRLLLLDLRLLFFDGVDQRDIDAVVLDAFDLPALIGEGQ